MISIIFDLVEDETYIICCVASGGLYVEDLDGKIRPDKQYLVGIWLQESIDNFSVQKF